MGKSGGSSPIPTMSELKGLAEFENTINNPNVTNMFGSQTFTRGADGRQTATQQLSPELGGLLGNIFGTMANGPSQFKPQGNQYTQDMINGFSQRVGERSGFSPSQYGGSQIQQPPRFPGIDSPAQKDNSDIPVGFRPPSPEPSLPPSIDPQPPSVQPKNKYDGLAGGNFGAAGMAGVLANGIGGLLKNRENKRLEDLL